MKILALAVCSILLVVCRAFDSPRITYLLPEQYEGAVVIALGQSDGAEVDVHKNPIVIEVPATGIVRLETTKEVVSGLPTFTLNGNENVDLTYLFRHNDPELPNGMSFDELNSEDFATKVFAMNYEEGVVNTASGTLRYLTFVVCKPKDGNRYASHDRNQKLKTLIEQFEGRNTPLE